MMDNPADNESHIPCQSWVGQNGWSTTSTQGSLFNPLPSSQHLSLGSSSGPRPSYNHPQASRQSCMIDMSCMSGLTSTPHSALYKTSHGSSNTSSTALFANTALPSSSHSISFVQQNLHTSSVLLTANQETNVPPPSLSQINQPPQPCRLQQLPLMSTHNPYKASFEPPVTNQGLPNRLQDLPISLPSFGQQHICRSQATSDGGNVEFAGVCGNTQSQSSSTSQEQHRWIPSTHCGGAANKSVPDAAAHPNEERSQEENMSPTARSERRRSELLNQRSRLLQQLAELDKCLESVPPDDSSDASPNTAIQSPSMGDSSQCEQNMTSDAQQVQLSGGKSKSQSRLSADFSLPASYDEQSETCAKPEDPMIEAVQVKKEDVSDESEDELDPDYCPNSDPDSPDVLSEPDDGSSDDSSHSSPSTLADRKPTPRGQKNAKLGISSLKAKSVPLVNQIRETNQKKSSEALVLPSSNSETQRVYDRRNYCLFCSKPVSKMSRHLERIHSDKIEVAAAFQYPKKSRERQKIWNRLINQGNFAHNKDVLKTGKGQLAVRKRPKNTRQARDFLHCLYCRGLYLKNALFRHAKVCPERMRNGKELCIGRKRIASQCVLEASEDLGISEGLKNILSAMTYNDVTQTIMDDKVILQFGELLFNQYGPDMVKHEYIRQYLRQIGRLVLEAQKITPLQKLEDFFRPSSFPHVVSAVNVLAGYNPENKSYSIPSLAIKLGYHLQKACSIVEGNAVECGDASLAESARNFLSVYQKKWNKLISGGALKTLREVKSSKTEKVPLAQDVKRLSAYMENLHVLAEKNLKDSPSAENYVALVKVILCRTVNFNRRRNVEVSLVTLKDFMSRKKSNLHAGMDVSVSELERTMCGFFTRIDIRGRCGRMVPVLLKPSFVSAMELFVKVRETCGVPSENPYLFARPNTLSAYRWSESIQTYVKECGAEHPEVLTSVKIRKHYTTMLQLINLDENEADQILGPNNQVQALRQNSGMALDDAEMDSDDILQPVRGQQVASWIHNEHPGACYGPAEIHQDQTHRTATNMTVPPKSVKSSKKGSKNKGKHKWEEAEVLAVERHMMHFIKRHKIPQKNDCIECLEAEPEALRSRSWKGVKDYVRNRITSLKSVKKCGSKDPQVLKSRKSRKHYTTLKQMNLDENKTIQTLAPNNQVQTLQQNSCMQLDDNEMDSEERLQPSRGQQAASWDHNEHPGACYGLAECYHEQANGATTATNMTVPPKSVKSSKKGAQNNGKHKWEEAEVLAVERHMMRFIKGHKVPQKNDCIECLEAEPEALRNRSWKGVKDYVRNRITALTRKSRASKAKSTNRNWP